MVKVLENNVLDELDQQQVAPIETNQESQGGKKCIQNRTQQLLIGIGIFICVTIFVTGLACTLLVAHISNCDQIYSSNCRNQSNTSLETFADFRRMSIGFITREQWTTRKTNSRIEGLNSPVPYIIVHQTFTDSCTTLTECEKQVRDIEDIHIHSRKLLEIGYNFLVGGDNGYIFEARGWTKVGAHASRYNSVSIGIAFIGVFEDKLPSNASQLAAQELIRIGVENNYIRKDYKLYGMRQLDTTTSPGQKLYNIIKKWPHWSHELQLDMYD